MTEYPCCPNPRCGHMLIDQPPGNATVQADNARAATAYVKLSDAYSKWKKKLRPQPICQETGDFLDKPPKPPKTLTSMLCCHCSQNGVDARRGKKCAVNCTISGTKYSLGQCPMCLCTCDAFVALDNYQTIRMATTLGAAQRAENRESTISFLDTYSNVNRMTQQDTFTHLHNMAKRGELASTNSQSVVNHIRNSGCLAQALGMLSNPPPQHILHDLRDKVDSIEHEAGPTHTSVCDMQCFGRASTAASARVYNNNLELSDYIPTSMPSEAEMIQQAMAASASAGISHPNTSSAAALAAYMPPNMSDDEMLRRAIAESTNANHNQARGGVVNDDPMSMSLSVECGDCWETAVPVGGRLFKHTYYLKLDCIQFVRLDDYL